MRVNVFFIAWVLLCAGFVFALDDQISVEVGDTFYIRSNYSCDEDSCEVIIGVGNVKTEEVVYHHENGSGIEEKDCFGETCLTMSLSHPVYNESGLVSWGCGSCDSVSFWISGDIRGLVKGDKKCFDGMKKVVGEDLCVETNNGERWDLVFDSWVGSGSDEFGYTRSREEFNFIGSGDRPFELKSDSNPEEFSLSNGESIEVEILLRAFEKGDYILHIYDGGEIEERSVNVEEKKRSSSGWSDDEDHRIDKSNDISLYPESSINEIEKRIPIMEPVVLSSSIESEESEDNYLVYILIGVVFVLLLIFLIIVLK